MACSKPISPEDYVYQLHLREVISYIAKNYNVYGIHLDYIRFIEPASASGKTEFIENLLSDINSDGSLRSDQLLSAAVYAADEGISYSYVWFVRGQDYSKMSQYLDFICPMAYHYPDHDASWVGDVTKFVKQKVDGNCLVIPDIQTFENKNKEPPYEEVIDAISNAIKNGASGVNIFRYGTTSKDDWRAVDDFFHSPEFTPLDLCMVLDRSGSMDDPMGDKKKIQGAKEAAADVVDVLLPHDRVSLISFSSTATTDIDFTSDFSAVKTEINQLSAYGWTSFGAGLEAALDQFDTHGNPDHIPAILFMSDGVHTTAPDPDAFVTECKNKEIPIYTVGFASSESEVDVTKLKNMADETGGEYLFADDIFKLQNIFIELQHKASGWESEATYTGEVNQGQTVTAGSFDIDSSTKNSRITLNWPGSDLDLELLNPDGMPVNLSAPDIISCVFG